MADLFSVENTTMVTATYVETTIPASTWKVFIQCRAAYDMRLSVDDGTTYFTIKHINPPLEIAATPMGGYVLPLLGTNGEIAEILCQKVAG